MHILTWNLKTQIHFVSLIAVYHLLFISIYYKYTKYQYFFLDAQILHSALSFEYGITTPPVVDEQYFIGKYLILKLAVSTVFFFFSCSYACCCMKCLEYLKMNNSCLGVSVKLNFTQGVFNNVAFFQNLNSSSLFSLFLKFTFQAALVNMMISDQ